VNLCFFGFVLTIFPSRSRKFIGPYDYRFNNSRMLDANRQPVAQKKHQMYGKRFAHESSVLPPPALHPNVPLKYEPYEPYAVSSNLDGAAASSSSVIKPPSSMMDSEMKYSYSLDFPLNRHLKSGSNGLASHELINHNHTYTMPHPGPLNSSGATPRPQTRDKKLKKSEEEHMTRDEKRARALHIPISVSFPVSSEEIQVARQLRDWLWRDTLSLGSKFW
jgi:nuclear factor erythroid 2, invertebrate